MDARGWVVVIFLSACTSNRSEMTAICSAPRLADEAVTAYLDRVLTEAASSAKDEKTKKDLSMLAIPDPETRAVMLCAVAVEAGLDSCELADVWAREAVFRMPRTPWPREGTSLRVSCPESPQGFAKVQAELDGSGLRGATLVPLRCPLLANAGSGCAVEWADGPGAPDAAKVQAAVEALGLLYTGTDQIRGGQVRASN